MFWGKENMNKVCEIGGIKVILKTVTTTNKLKLIYRVIYFSAMQLPNAIERNPAHHSQSER